MASSAVAPEGVSNLFVKTGEHSEHTYNFDLVVGTPAQAYRVVNIFGPHSDSSPVNKQPIPTKYATSLPPVIKAIDLSDAVRTAGLTPFEFSQGLQLTQPITPPPSPSGNSLPQSVSGFTPAKALKKAEPTYPEIARNNNITGSVVVEVMINEKGKVIKGAALSGPLQLKQAAVDAARRWEFEPATENGKPSQFTTRITFNFVTER